MLQSKLGMLIALLTILSGCTQARYSAATLPQQYAARPHINASQIDFSTLQRNSVPNEWLQPGDSVNVSIVTGIEKTPPPQWELTINNDGTLSVPLVGPTPVAGLDPSAAAMRIREDAIRRGMYVDPKVTVGIAKKRTYQISVVGAVNKPDTYEIPAASCDVLTAITMAEGVSDEASRYIQIKHSPTTLGNLGLAPPTVGPNGVMLASAQTTSPIPSVVNIDLANAPSLPPESLRLYDGSVVSVSREPRRYVSVLGLVRTPKQVEVPNGEELNLLSAIAGAGGTSISLADKVLIVRKNPNSPEPIVIEASIKEAREGGQSNLMLADGDVVSVEETASTMVVQAVQTFFRVGFSAAIPGL